MLWHIFGPMGSGKSWIAVVLAEDFNIKEGRKIYANFNIVFGELIDMEKFLNFEYENCFVIWDEAYGVADSHAHTKSNDLISTVVLQSRKRDVEIVFVTQNQGDLYKRIRDLPERRIICENIGTKQDPILRYLILDNTGMPIEALEFDTETVKGAYHLYNSFETIMPMQLNTGTFFEEVDELFNDVKKKKPFELLLNRKNPYITREMCGVIYDLMEMEKYDRVKKILKSVG
jgi:hypothetical protein